ncbi:MAG: SRPBCC family protein [Planctomycetota bacterium]
MRPVSASIAIAASPDRVFAVATDLAGAADRVRGIDELEVLTEGPFGLGTRWRETRTMMGAQATETMTVTALEPGRSYTTVAESHGCRYTSDLSVAPEGDGARATFAIRGEPTSLRSRVVLALMTPLNGLLARQVRKAFEEDLADLRAAAEREA